MKICKAQAMVLKKVNYSDSDLIIRFLTTKGEKLSLFAKSAKNSKKRFTGGLDFFDLIQIEFIESKSSGLGKLRDSVIEESFSNVRLSMKKFAIASYYIEIVDSFLKEGDVDLRIAENTFNFFHDLNESIDDFKTYIAYTLRLLDLFGLFKRIEMQDNRIYVHKKINKNITEFLGYKLKSFDFLNGVLNDDCG